MKRTNLESDLEILAWKARDNERAAQQILKESREEGFARGFAKGMKKGIKKGKLKGEIEGEILQIKDFIDLGILEEKFVPKLKFLTDPKLLSQLEHNLEYIKNHKDDTESVICDELGLCDALWEVEDLS